MTPDLLGVCSISCKMGDLALPLKHIYEFLVSVNSDNLPFVLSIHGGNRNKKMGTQTFLGKPGALELLLPWYVFTDLCGNALIFLITLTTLEYMHQFLMPKSAKG